MQGECIDLSRREDPGHPPVAHFYRLTDKQNNRNNWNATFNAALHQMGLAVNARVLAFVNANHARPTDAELRNSFDLADQDLANGRAAVVPGSAQDVALEEGQHLLAKFRQDLATRTALIGTISLADGSVDWTQAIVQARIDKVVMDHSDEIFFGCNDADVAHAEGEIYDPQDHNWGTNVGWVLGLIHKGVDIDLKSAFNAANRLRERPGYPSAFALEIAMALQAGYTLDYTHATGAIRLISPGAGAGQVHGVPGGAGVLPTRQQQNAIYDAFVQAVNGARLAGNNAQFFLAPPALPPAPPPPPPPPAPPPPAPARARSSSTLVLSGDMKGRKRTNTLDSPSDEGPSVTGPKKTKPTGN